MKINIDKEEFKTLILEGYTIKQLQEYYGCGRTTITKRKKELGLIGLSPNSKKRDNGDGTKTCSKCGVTKHLDKFYSNGLSPTGERKYKPSCKHCESSLNIESYYSKIKTLLKEQGREYKCELCDYAGNHAALTFHHNTDEKNFEISNKSKTSSIEVLRPEIAICQLLCQNCHHEIHNPLLMIYGDD